MKFEKYQISQENKIVFLGRKGGIRWKILIYHLLPSPCILAKIVAVAQHRRGGDRFEFQLNTTSYLKTLKMVYTDAMPNALYKLFEYLVCLSPKQTYYYAQLGRPDKGRVNKEFKELVLCWVLLNFISGVLGQEELAQICQFGILCCWT